MTADAHTMNAYANQFLRAFRQAPWRTQTQTVATWSVVLLIIAVVGGLYLAVASRAGTAGRDLQRLEARKAELIQQNDELQATLSQLRSMDRMASRARQLGFAPAEAQQIEYLSVPSYPMLAQTPASPATQTATLPESPSGWLAGALGRLIPQSDSGHGG